MLRELDTLARLYTQREVLDAKIRHAEDVVREGIMAARTDNTPHGVGAGIAFLVAAQCGVPESFLTSRIKTREYAEARALAYHVARFAGWTVTRIADWSERDHSTVVKQMQAHKNLIEEARRLYGELVRTSDAA